MNNTSDKLLPCPFCGTTWTALNISESVHWRPHVECDNCGATGPMDDEVEVAIVLWNHRQKVSQANTSRDR